MWRYDDLAIILEVIKQGSFIKASKKLNIPSSTISRRVSEFESAIGVRLLERNSRQFSLTEKGKQLFEQSRAPLQGIRQTVENLQLDNDMPIGKLNVTAPVTLGNELLSGWFSDFAQLHPKINLDIVLSNQLENIVDDSFDVAIRVGPLKDSDLIAQYLFTSNSILCATPKYLANSSKDITCLQDIEACEMLSYSSHKQTLLVQTLNDSKNTSLKISTRVSSTSTAVLRAAAINGLGIACLPKVSVQSQLDSGELVHLFEDVVGIPSVEIYAVYPSKQYLPKKTTLFLNYIKERSSTLRD